MKTYYFDDIVYYKGRLEDGICVTRHAPAFSELPHKHDFYEISYIYEGSGIETVNGISYPIQQGNLMVFKPGDVQCYHTKSDMSVFNCNFLLREPLPSFHSNPPLPLILLLDDYYQFQIEQLFYLLEEELIHLRPQYYPAVWHLLDFIFLTIFRNITNLTLTDPVWGNVMSYITENLRIVEFSKAVKIFGTSTGHFCRLFKRDFGMPFNKYVTLLRIQHSKNLLINTQKKVFEIYELCGYNNNRRFFVDFKNIVGMTPNQYRKNII